MRFIPNNIHTFIKNKDIYILILNNKDFVYKIPLGSYQFEKNVFLAGGTSQKNLFICPTTFYHSTFIYFYSSGNILIDSTGVHKKFLTYKPIFFNKLRYVGKGFKLVIKKKKFFNCIFGNSHIYWVKLQKTITKRTRKYKISFITKSLPTYIRTVSILKKIKPINRYTLRGVRTYTHV